MAPRFEHLQTIGSFGLVCEDDFAIIEHELGDGYDESILIGSSAGTRYWRLQWNVLPQTLDGPIMLGTGEESRADYIRNFFRRRKAEANSSFIITDPFTGRRYLAKIVEHRLSLEMMMIKLWKTGLLLKQRRERGVATLEDGSLGEFDEGGDEI